MTDDIPPPRLPLSEAALTGHLVRPGGLWREVSVMPRTGSTNADLVARAGGGAPEGLVLAAEEQTAGRGRLGRSWLSPPHAALTFSLLLRPVGVPPARRGWLPLLAGVATATAVRQVSGLDAVLKWPNDVLLGPRKLAGILAEQSGDAVVIGIGLNVSTARDELPAAGATSLPATSLLLEGSASLDRGLLLSRILAGAERWYLAWRGTDPPGDPGTSGLRAAYLRLCATVGRDVRVELPTGTLSAGTATGLDADGRLIVSTPEGPLAVGAGDVRHVRSPGAGQHRRALEVRSPNVNAHPAGPATDSPSTADSVAETRARIEQGGAPRYHEAAAAKGKLFARERISLLVDAGSFTEDGRYANALADGLPADSVITGTALIDGRPVALMGNDSTVKAGSWGSRTVEKIIRVIEKAYLSGLPMIYLVDSAGARITDQVEMFPGRRGAGRIFHAQVRASGSIPQVCALFGPSAAGGAYIPAFCDFVAMVEGNASMYLGSPRMVEMVVREKTTLEEMGGARMHCTVSGCGHFLAPTERDALGAVRAYLSYLPGNWEQSPPTAPPRDPEPADLRALVPASERQAFDMRHYVRGLVDEGSLFEVHALWARELLVGFARVGGQVTGIVANNPMYKGGVLFVDSADKGTRFIQTCDAFGIPLLFLADVPGFMVGTAVERQGIIRHGAKMISAVSDATVPKICVVVRKAYGAGLYAMAGPGFEPDATLALPTAKIAVMGAEAAVNAVYAGKLAEITDPDERAAETARLRQAYDRDIDIMRLAGDLVVDDIVEPEDLRAELIRRFAAARGKDRAAPRRRHGIAPV